MTNALATRPELGDQIEQVLIGGDLSRLSSAERVSYYNAVCASLGLNPLTRPFDYINLNGKLTLYAKRDCTEQLRKLRSVSVTIVSREVVEDCYVVTARATDRTGRTDESIGVVPIANLKGEQRANAMMKGETKSKRRVTLSICGLGLLDELEVESITGDRQPPKAAGGQPLSPSASGAASPVFTTATSTGPRKGIMRLADEILGSDEDPEYDPNDNEYTAPVERFEPETGEFVGVSEGITQAQNKLIHKLRDDLGHHLDSVEQYEEDGKRRSRTVPDGKYYAKLLEHFGKRSTDELTRKEAQRTITWLQAMVDKLNQRAMGDDLSSAAQQTALELGAGK